MAISRMAIDERRAVPVSGPTPMVAERSRELQAYACSGCGYGIAVVGVLPSCPMCGADAWEPERLRERSRPRPAA